jgi:hypothetical protein
MPEQKQPQFKIVTGALKAVDSPDGRRVLHCTASSTITDRHGDEITEECIRDMSKQAVEKSMTIFLNHHYIVPEDVIAKTYATQVLNRVKADDGGQIWDLDLDIEMVNSNPRADKTWDLLKGDLVKLGVSIGAMIEDWEYIDKDAGFWGGLRIKKVDLLEASIVGIPANQRSWVQNAVKAIKSFTTSADAEENEETSEMPDPIVLSADPIEEPAVTETPESAPESVEAAAEPETPEAAPESEETLQELPVLAAALEEESEIEDDSEDAGEVSDSDIVLALTLTVDDLRAQLKDAMAEIETLRQKNVELTEYVADADAVLTTVAKTPIGRKTSIAKTVDTFHTKVVEMYGEEAAKYLEI